MDFQQQEVKPQFDVVDNAERNKTQFWNIFVFEYFGTMLLVYGALASQSSSTGIALIYFVTLIIFGRISGGHFNPVITLMLLVEGSIQSRQAVSYVIPQFLGSLSAGLLGIPMLNLKNGPYEEINPSAHVFGTLIAELFGSFLFFLFVCVQMNKKTEVSASPIISSLFISTIFYIAREFTITMDNSLFNPAAASGLLLFYGIYNGQWVQWVNMVTYLGGPWVGALGAMTFYYSVYVKTLLEKQ